MTNKEIADYLTELVHVDYDAARCYEDSAKEVDDPAIKSYFIQFMADHERHVTDLCAEITRLGETPPERKRDIKGAFIEGFTAIRAKIGQNGALHAMESNEKLTNKKYRAAIDKDVPWNIKDLFQRNYQDEVHHLEYIEQMLHVRAR